MTTAGERIAHVEGVLEQIDVRLSRLEQIAMGIMEQKADKTEVRLLFGTTMVMLAAIISLLGVVLTKV